MITTVTARVKKGLIVPNVPLNLLDGAEVTVHVEESPQTATADITSAVSRSDRLVTFLDALEHDPDVASVPALSIENTTRESIYDDRANGL